jgi:preprotein translocase subunit SecA
MRAQTVEDIVRRHIPEHAYAEQWDAPGLAEEVQKLYDLELPIVEWAKEEGIADEEMIERIAGAVEKRAAERAANFGVDVIRYLEKAILLQTLDHDWREHIVHLDHLRQFVGLRGYGQRDPLNEYKSEALTLFENLLTQLRHNVVRQLMHVQVNMQPQPFDEMELPEMEAHHYDPTTGEDDMFGDGAAPSMGTVRLRADPDMPLDPNDPRTWGKVGRNAPCPCGSGKKFKQCHGALV